MAETRNNLTEGPILKSLLTLTLPIMIGNILQTAYQLIDTFWVGRLGANAVAAVSISFPILFLIISLGSGLAIAGTILVAQYKGMGNQKEVNKVSEQTFVLVFFLSAILMIIGYFLSPFIMRIMGAAPEIFNDSVAYLKISFLGMIFLFGYFVFQSLMRGFGDAKTPLYIVLGTVTLNTILDPIFIFGFGPIKGMGVAGAALATILTQAIAAIIGVSMLFTGKYGIHLQKKNLKPDFTLIKRIFLLGFPTSIEQSTRALGFTIMTILVATFGTITLASYGIGTRIQSFVIIPALSLSIANSTLIGQNIGAKKPERAEKIARVSAILGFLALTTIGILFFIFSEQIVKAFIPGNPIVISSGSLFLRIMCLTYGLIGIQMALFGTFRGAGHTKITMVLAGITLIIQFLTAWILSKFTPLGEIGLWIGFPVSNLFGALIAWIIFSQGKWKKTIHMKETPECDIIEI